MDKPLTPSKIQKLIYFAENKSFNNSSKRNPDEEAKQSVSQQTFNKSFTKYESSSGLLDLERIEAFGESAVGNGSLSRSTAFIPGEMTGRSTGTEEIKPQNNLVPQVKILEENRRHTMNLDIIQSHCDRQTHEVHNILRNSISTDITFHSKRDLTADEESLIRRETGMDSQQKLQTIPDSPIMNASNQSVGTYFKSRCPNMSKMLGKTDSPDRSVWQNMDEVTSSIPSQPAVREKSYTHKTDPSLDTLPVRQPCNLVNKMIDNEIIRDPNTTKRFEKQYNYNEIKLTDKQVDSSNLKNKEIRDETMNTNKNMQMYHSRKIAPTSTNKMNLVSDLIKTDHEPCAVQLTQTNMFCRPTEDTGSSVDNSFSISKIAHFLEKDSSVRLSDMLNMNKKSGKKKRPLTELQMNNKMICEVQVTKLIDTKKAETATSTGSVNTVISLDKLKINQEDKKKIPEVIVTHHTLTQSDIQKVEKENVKYEQKKERSKSPSCKSQSTQNTVQENFTSFKSGDSLLHSSRGEANTSHVPSPNLAYKELDKSVDWQEVLQQKHSKEEGLAKEQWVEIMTKPVDGFVGVSTAVNITVMSLTDSWLISRVQFESLPNEGKDFIIELPRNHTLLSPGKSEQLTIHLTSNVEINTTLPFTIFIKDASIDYEIEKKGNIELNIKTPTIQVLSSDGVNKIAFQPIQEGLSLIKSFVVLSDCPVDLQLDLSIVEGDSMFSIRNVQEVKRSDVTKILMERQGSNEETQQTNKAKSKAKNKQLCRLKSGNAIRVSVKFMAPKLSELQLSEKLVTFNGSLNVHLIGVTIMLKKVDLIAVVGSVTLVIPVTGDKLKLTKEPASVTLSNTGSISGMWIVKFKNTSSNTSSTFPFKVSTTKFEIHPGGNKVLNLLYTGPEDCINEGILIFEDVASGNKTMLAVSGGAEKQTLFPIKTNYSSMSWVRIGRKELSLKNSINKKVHVRCQIVGEGFAIDLPGVESRGIFCLPFEPYECRPLPVTFTPNTFMPHTATLYIAFDKNSDTSRKINLYGCASNGSVKWAGLVTYGDTALVRAVSRAPIDLMVYNKSQVSAFISARVHFNLQYSRAAETSRLEGDRRVVRPRTEHVLRMRVEWPPLERRARSTTTTALATVTVLTGDEFTRRRILRIIKNESNGELDASLLPDYLKVLVEKFDDEDVNMDSFLTDFNETKASLDELIGGIKELTAQIDLPQDFGDENTIIITDDTVIEHHTLCD